MRRATVFLGLMFGCGGVVESAPPPEIEARFDEPSIELREMVPDGVEFTFQGEHTPMVGERLTFEKDGVMVVGVINSNGVVRLPLDEGLWSVRGPMPISPDHVWVSRERREMNLSVVPRGRVSGCVVDEAGKPVAGARIHVTGEPDADVVATQRNGCFSFEVDGPSAQVHAFTRSSVSAVKNVKVPEAGVSLVLVPLFPLSVQFEPEDMGHAFAAVSTRVGLRFMECPEPTECRVLIPSGPFSVVGGGEHQRQKMWGQRPGIAPAAPSEVRVKLHEVFDSIRDAPPDPPAPIVVTEHSTAFASREPVDVERPFKPRTRRGPVYWSFPWWHVTWAPSDVQPPRTVLLGE